MSKKNCSWFDYPESHTNLRIIERLFAQKLPQKLLKFTSIATWITLLYSTNCSGTGIELLQECPDKLPASQCMPYTANGTVKREAYAVAWNLIKRRKNRQNWLRWRCRWRTTPLFPSRNTSFSLTLLIILTFATWLMQRQLEPAEWRWRT